MSGLIWWNDYFDIDGEPELIERAQSSLKYGDGYSHVWRITPDPRGGFTLQESDEPLRPIDSRFRDVETAKAHAEWLEEEVQKREIAASN